MTYCLNKRTSFKADPVKWFYCLFPLRIMEEYGNGIGKNLSIRENSITHYEKYKCRIGNLLRELSETIKKRVRFTDSELIQTRSKNTNGRYKGGRKQEKFKR